MARRRWLQYILLASIQATFAFSQVRTGQTNPSQNPNASRPPITPTTPPKPTTTYNRPVLLSGRVVLADGTSLPEPVAIERVCGIRTYRETFTDLHGDFVLEVGQNLQSMTDVADSPDRVRLGSGIYPNDLADCELRAALTGYHSQSIMLAPIRQQDVTDLGDIVLTYMGFSKPSTISATSSLAPKAAQKAFEKGVAQGREKKDDEARTSFLAAVELYPKYAEAWFHLGLIYERGNRGSEAMGAYGKAIEADPRYVKPYQRIYLLSAQAQKWPEVAAASEKALRLNPYEFGDAFYYNAVANLQLGKLDEAEKSARSSAQQVEKKTQARGQYVLGLVLQAKGEFPEAAETLRAFLRANPEDPNTERVRRLIADADAKSQGELLKPVRAE